MTKLDILNISINNISLKNLLRQIKQGGFIITPNVDHLIKLQHDPEFFHVYQTADYVICDSQILMWIALFLGKRIQEKISGSDFFPAFYEYYKDDPDIRVFLLGSREGVAQIAQERINQRVGRELVVGVHSPSFGFERNLDECEKILDIINATDANVLAVGVGAPKQEKWIYKYRHRLSHIKIFLAIGATIDFEAGVTRRAPRYISRWGLEWIYRILAEPRRLWKRYLFDILPMFWLATKQKFNRYRYKKPLELLLHEAGLLSMKQVEFLLEQQGKEPSQRFGELIMQQGWVKAQTVRFFLVELPQWLQQKRSYSVTEYLQFSGLLSDEQVDQLVRDQAIEPIALELLAVQYGWVKDETVNFFRRAQRLAHKKNVNSFERVYFYKPRAS